LKFKRQIAIALAGALISAACFGSGVAMVMPLLKLLLHDQQSLGHWVATNTEGTFLEPIGAGLAAVIPDDRFAAFALAMGTVGLLAVIGSTGRYIHESMSIEVVLRSAMVWRSRLFRRLIHADFGHLLLSGHSDYISRIVTDTRVLSAAYSALLSKSAAKILNALFATIWALVYDWVLTLMAILITPVMVLMIRKFGNIIRRASRRALGVTGQMLTMLGEAFGSIRVVRVHGAEGIERRRFNRINRQLFAEEMRMRRTKAITSPLIETMAIASVLGVALFAAWYVLRQDRPPEQFMAVLVMLCAAAASLKPLSGLSTTLYEAGAAAERVMVMWRAPVEPMGALATEPHRPLPRLARSITFSSVTYHYPGQTTPALDHLSLEITHGEMVAVVGTNGSGKTTLVSLLPRVLIPTDGKILIDGTDIQKVGLRQLRDQIAVVTQETALFGGTIHDNIAYGRKWLSRDRVVAAAKAAMADEFITALPRGYDTVLGERGVGLSGGQGQRIAIARAILREPTLLILDEATSQIDADSESQINEALRQLRRHRTTIAVAHRLSTVIEADRIVVMEQGRIADIGDHEALLKRCSLYQTLTRTQMYSEAG